MPRRETETAMPDRITRWLEELGLAQYADAFKENAIDWELLPDVDQDTLKDIGVKAAGHRLRLIKAIAALDANAEPKPPRAQDERVPTLAPASATEHDPAAWERQPGERKPVTMLFADVVGSTAMTEELDAEDAHALLYGATQRMCEAVEQHRGTVCRFMGDGVMAMFGAPVASEHHAVDACEAALAMQQAVQDYARAFAGPARPAIRVGLHSGEVVVLTVGDGAKVEYDASGPTVPIAARMEQAATVGDIYLTSSTRNLGGKRIEVSARDPVEVKGITEPLPVYVLTAVRPLEEAFLAGERTPFFGRRAEVHQFCGLLDACVEEGEGQALYIRGEPGIGKTRLVEEFAKIATERGLAAHRGLVLPFGVGKGQDAIRSVVRSLLGIPVTSGKALRRQAADRVLDEGMLGSDQAVFLNDLLDLPQSTELHALYDAMDNATRNEGKQAVACALLTASASRQPVFVAIENVHWADGVTLAHLAALTRTVAQCSALLAMTSRVEGDQLGQAWRSTIAGNPLFTIDLGPLREQDTIELASQYLDADDPLARRCLERAAGNPLFLEQLLHTAREGSGEVLPDSIQSLVLARLDRLDATDKRALQAASILGQRFDLDVLRHLIDDADYDCLTLVEHNLVRSEGAGFLFAHALIQEGVYGSLLKHQRQTLHRSAARWYAGKDLVLIAEHSGRAGDPEAAAAYLAAARAQAGEYRYETARRLIEDGLRAEPMQAIRHQLMCFRGEVLQDLGDVESSMSTYSEIVDSAVDDTQCCDGWMGLAAGMRLSTNYSAGLELLTKVEPIATRDSQTLRLSQLHHLRGNLCFSLGRQEDCLNEHHSALEYARDCDSIEAEVRALGGLGDAEYARGHMRSARDYLRQCLEMCREHGFGRVEVANRAQLGIATYYCGQWQEAQSEFDAAIQAAQRVGHRRAEMNARAAECEGQIEAGSWSEVEKHVERGLVLAKELGARAWEPNFLSARAQVLISHNRQQEAMQVLLEAEKIQQEMGSSAFTAGEVYGAMVLAAQDGPTRVLAFENGEMVARERCLAHVRFRLYRSAMEAFLRCQDWDRVRQIADALERVTRSEPLEWSDFYIRRARALARCGRGGHQNEILAQELKTLCDEAERIGRWAAVPVLKVALSDL